MHALGLGLLARRAADAWRAGRAARLAALPAGAALALLLALDLRVSPLVHTYDEWPLMGRLTRTALSSAAGAATELEPRQSRDLGFIPGILPRRELGPGIEAVGLEDYTLQAFLEVEHPDVDVQVVPLPEDAELLTIPGKRLLGVRLATLGRAPREE